MANELKIVVKFDTGEASRKTKEYAEGSVGALEQSLRKARLALKDLQVGTAEHIAALANFKKTQAEVNDATGRGIVATKNMAGASANASVTLQALNYTVRDSAYFTRDFSLGILAVGNNLNPLIDGFIRMKQETGSYKGAMSALLSTLTGPAGVMFAFSIVVTAIQAVTFAMAKNKKEVGETKTEYEKLTDAVKTYSRSKIQAALAEQEAVLATLNLEKEQFDLSLARAREAAGKYGETFVAPVFAKDEDIANAQKAVDILYNELTTLGDINEISRKITELEKERNDVIGDPKRIQSLERQIQALRESEKTLRGLGDTKKGAGYETLREKRAKLEAEMAEAKTLEEKIYLGDQIVAINEKLNPILKEQEETVKGLRDAYKEVLDMFASDTMLSEMISKGGKTSTPSAPSFGKDYIYGGMGKEEMDRVSDDINTALDAVIEKQREATSLASDLGNSLFDAFIQGKKGLDEFLSSLALAIGKMLFFEAIKFGIGSITGATGLSTIFGVVGGSKSIQVPTIPNTAPISQTVGLQQSMQAMNANIAGMREPTIIIQADTDAMRFTRVKTNPAQAKLRRGNISVV